MCLPRSLTPERITAMTSNAAVAAYLDGLPEPMRDVATRLVALVDAELPGAEGALWYGHPVWRLGGEPAVLVKAYGRHVTLGFWRGREVGSDGGLTPAGGRTMASVKVTGEIPAGAAGWLRRAAALPAAAVAS
jgi:hypothetical protein